MTGARVVPDPDDIPSDRSVNQGFSNAAPFREQISAISAYC